MKQSGSCPTYTPSIFICNNGSNWTGATKSAPPEAARWLDKAGLLTDRKGGLPLRNLLRAGRIAGQQQRPDKKNGRWFIRRLAVSRDPDAIRDARERLRRYLPIDRDALPPDWPVNQGPAVFWQEFGKTVAAFGYLEHILASTCYALLATGERAVALLEANDHEAMRQWTERLLNSRTDSLRRLTLELDRVLDETGLVPRAVREDLVARLDELRPWRNALCHGAWLSVAEDGSARLEHVYGTNAFPPGSSGTLTSSACPTSAPGRSISPYASPKPPPSPGPPTPYGRHRLRPGHRHARMYAPRSAPPEPELLHAARRTVARRYA